MNHERDEPRQSGVLGALSRRVLQVEPGEWGAILVAWFYFYMLLASYYMLRPIRETMGIAGGADNLPVLMTGTFVAMFFANIAFAWLASRTRRRTFIPLANRFFALNLLVFLALLRFSEPGERVWIGYAFYVWLSVFNLFVISIFWAFLGDVFRTRESRRLFGFIGVGGTLGAITGAGLTGALIEAVGPAGMLLASAVALELATQAMLMLGRMRRARLEETRIGGEAAAPLDNAAEAQAAADREPGPGVWTGVVTTARSPYLLLICLYLLLYTLTSTFLYIEQGHIVAAFLTEDDARTRFFAGVDLWTNVLTLLTQMFLTARLIRWFGVGVTFALLPLVATIGFAALWAAPTLAVLFAVQVVRRGMNYAVARPVRETLFAPLSPDEKYKSKPFIDTFIYRGGDAAGGWMAHAFRALGVTLGWFAIPAGLLWAVVALAVGRLEAKRRQEAPSPLTAPPLSPRP